jgi:voltage-gated potassium channel
MVKQILHSRITLAVVLCLSVVVVGTMGYMTIEDYTLVQGLYMSAITISTVGYGEVKPLSSYGQAFTTGLILLGFMSIAFAGHTLGQSLLEKVWSGQAEKKKMRKQIQSLKDHYILCGFGRVGAAAAACFEASAVDFVVIEANEANHVLLQEKGFCHIIGDATHEGILEEAGIKRASGLLSLLNADPDNLFVVFSAREMNPLLHIISRVDESSSNHKIIRAGADNVISPFASTGKRIANDLLNATGKGDAFSHASVDGGDPVMRWIEVTQASDMIGYPLNLLKQKIGSPVIGLRRQAVDMLMPDESTVLQRHDQLMVLASTGRAENETASAVKKPLRLVIVDDNPVIIKLYMRLFQKAGFIAQAAINGQAGLDMILKERPDVAVIDYQLPLMSGIDVCRHIRKHMDQGEIKLILFTMDHSEETKQKALDAGADAVVVKSPEASEVIKTVINFIKG